MNKRKQDSIQKVVKLIDEYPIVGLVDMESLPGKNLGAMRKQLREKIVLYMTKKRLIKRAFEESKKKDVKNLESKFRGMPALLFTKENPFTLFKTLKKNQSKAPIKAGQVAPNDLIVPAGPTSFQPGPIIGELGQLGIKGGVEGGKVVIKEDAVLAREGDVVDGKRAAFLTKMGVEPMRIGLNLVALYENGEIIDSKVLDIDEDKFMADLQLCAQQARSLSLNSGFPTKDTIEAMLQKAHLEAASLALETNLITDSNVKELLAKAHSHASGISKHFPNQKEPQEQAEVKEEKPEEKEPENKDTASGLGALFG